MTEIIIAAGPFTFGARLEVEAAPKTCAAFAASGSRQSHSFRVTLIPRSSLPTEIGRVRRANRSESGVGEDFLRRDILAGLAFCVIIGTLAFLFAEIASLAGWAPPLEALLSFAPGGQAEMAMLTIVAGADLAFVVTHHVLRIIVVIVGAPIVGQRLNWKKTNEDRHN